jgi:hypothetical protein
MSIQEVSAEQLAELFHHYHQALGQTLAPRASQTLKHGAGTTTGKEPSGRCCPSGIAGIASTDRKRENPRRYFAKPGEAEWGC